MGVQDGLGDFGDAGPSRMGCDLSELSLALWLAAEVGQVCSACSCSCVLAVPGASFCHPLFISAQSQRAASAGRPQLCLFCCFPVRDKPAFPFFISC